MGPARRAISVHDEGRWVFNRLAADYAARPGYPPELVARLLAIGGGPGAVVADLGAGTGLLAAPLAAAGARVLAVDPARGMLDALRAVAGVEPVHAPAEATGLPAAGCALAVLADALQWVEPEEAGRECARLLAPGGAVAIVEPSLAPSPALDALAAVFAAANPKARPRRPERRERLLRAAGVRGAPELEVFPHAEWLAPARLAAVVRSLSYVGPALGPARLAEVLAAVARVAPAGVLWERRLTLAWGRTRAGAQRRGAGGR
jgi:SAM-dependent methyltransferase